MISDGSRRDPDFGPIVRGTPAPCRAACPVGTDAAAYVALLAEGRVADAYDVARQPNPFASVCGRVCSAPCERSCRRGVVDSAISIRALKRVLCDAHGAEQGDQSRWMRAVGTLPPITEASVGIVGAGPAGLAAAHDLRRAGHAITIYEALPLPGGMMRYGIPAFRLPRTVLDAEIDAIISLGIELRLGCAIGRDVTFDELLARHAAILLTVGCQQGRSLRAPGADLPGVMRAVDFLRSQNARVDDAGSASTLSTTPSTPGPVVVIGGGSVAFDAARSAWRSGRTSAYDAQIALDAARSAQRSASARDSVDASKQLEGGVTMIAPESRAALPVPDEELHEATLEGVTLRDGHGVVRVVGDSHVTGVEIAPVRSLFDAEGRFAPELDLERATVLPARTVVLAIGQQSDTDFLAGQDDIARTSWGGIVVDERLRSTHPRVWAAGDVASGPRDLIDAIAAGQRAAAGIVAALRDVTGMPPRPRVSIAPPLDEATRFWSEYDTIRRTPLPVIQPTTRDALAEVEQSLSLGPARVEAARCLRCDEHLQFSATRCIACALCVDVCPHACLSLVPLGSRAPLEAYRDDPEANPKPALAMLFDDNTCIRCGLCVHRCPTDALEFVLAPASADDSLTAPDAAKTVSRAEGAHAGH